jgi:nitrite reductase/ring-hydroxylating ferredoxin subunit
MSTFQRAARLDELPEGRGRCVRFGELEIALFRVGDAVYAMENRCPHANYPLSEGQLRGPIVICPAHGWDFDVRTGFSPGNDDGWPIPCFAVRIDGGEVWVDVSRPTNLRGR